MATALVNWIVLAVIVVVLVVALFAMLRLVVPGRTRQEGVGRWRYFARQSRPVDRSTRGPDNT